MANYSFRDRCGCGVDIPKGTTINIEPPTPGEIILKVILCLISFAFGTLFCKWIGIPVLYSAIIGLILALCCGGCLSFLIRELDSLFKIH